MAEQGKLCIHLQQSKEANHTFECSECGITQCDKCEVNYACSICHQECIKHKCDDCSISSKEPFAVCMSCGYPVCENHRVQIGKYKFRDTFCQERFTKIFQDKVTKHSPKLPLDIRTAQCVAFKDELAGYFYWVTKRNIENREKDNIYDRVRAIKYLDDMWDLESCHGLPCDRILFDCGKDIFYQYRHALEDIGFSFATYWKDVYQTVKATPLLIAMLERVEELVIDAEVQSLTGGKTKKQKTLEAELDPEKEFRRLIEKIDKEANDKLSKIPPPWI